MKKLSRILHPTDFSEHSKLAFEYACLVASRFTSELHLLHIFPDPRSTTSPYMVDFLPVDFCYELRQQHERRLEEIMPGTGDENICLVRTVMEGKPFVEIIKYSKAKDIEMIVMGTHGISGLQHLIIGSVAENVVRKADCPVMTIHSDDHKFTMP